MIKVHRRTALLGATGLLAAAGAQISATPMPQTGKRDWAAQVPTIRIGLLSGENDGDRLGRFDAYGKLIEATFGVPVRMFPAADYSGTIQAFGAKQIEIASMGPSAYAGAWLDTNGNVEPLVVSVESDGSISYRLVMVTRADSGIVTLQDMRGKSLVWADPNSTSYLVPRSELRKSGIDPEPGRFFSRTGFGGGHEQVIVAVLHKQYDAAVTWISGIGDPATGFTRGNLHEMVAKGMLNMADLRILWTSSPVLNGPLTARKDTPQAFRDDLRNFHLALPTAHPAIYTQIERGGGTGYQAVTHADYQIFIDLRKEEAANRRQRP